MCELSLVGVSEAVLSSCEGSASEVFIISSCEVSALVAVEVFISSCELSALVVEVFISSCEGSPLVIESLVIKITHLHNNI